jgi:hypothetical protein
MTVELSPHIYKERRLSVFAQSANENVWTEERRGSRRMENYVMRSFIICVLHQIVLACNMRGDAMTDMINACKFLNGKLNWRNHFGD